MSGSIRAGTANSAAGGSYADQRTRVSDPSSFSRVESGYKTMDKILANEKLSKSKLKFYIAIPIYELNDNEHFEFTDEMLEMLQTEFNEV